jgi:ribosomal protein L37AE/L43A/heat shock protein HspQ
MSNPQQIKICTNPDCSNVVKRPNQKFCCEKCKNAVNNAKRITIKIKTCTVCKKIFETTDNKLKICSDKCSIDRNELEKKELHNYISRLRFEFIELINDQDREHYADMLIDKYITDRQTQHAFFMFQSKSISKFNIANYNPEFKYNPLPHKLKRKNIDNLYHVVIDDQYDMKSLTYDVVANIFYGIPDRSLNFPTIAGSYKTKAAALQKLRQLEQILAYNDERTLLLLDARIVENDLFEAIVYTEELKKYTDVFVYTANRCKQLYGDTLYNYRKSLVDPKHQKIDIFDLIFDNKSGR